MFSYYGTTEFSIGEQFFGGFFGHLKQSISLLTPCVFSLQHILGSLVLKDSAIQQQGYAAPWRHDSTPTSPIGHFHVNRSKQG